MSGLISVNNHFLKFDTYRHMDDELGRLVFDGQMTTI